MIVCHCDACHEATGGPWAASAAHRPDLTVDDATLTWEKAAVSSTTRAAAAAGAAGRSSSGMRRAVRPCRSPSGLLEGGAELEVVAHIWVPEDEQAALAATGVRVEPNGLPESVGVRWHPEAASE